MRTLTDQIIKFEGQTVFLAGFVAARRDHGKIIFIDLRDRTGQAQLVFIAQNKDIYALAEKLRPEWVIRVEGMVNRRPAAMINKEIPTGEYEVLVEKLEILNEAVTPPFDVSTNGLEIGEEARMKYRYIDLRRDRLQKNIRNRYKMLKFFRDHLTGHDFVEIETPILSKSTPE